MPFRHRKSEPTLLSQYCSDLVICICPDRFSVFLIAWLLSLVLSAEGHWRSAKAQRYKARGVGLWGEGSPKSQGSERPQTLSFIFPFPIKTAMMMMIFYCSCLSDGDDDEVISNILLLVSEWGYACHERDSGENQPCERPALIATDSSAS